MTPGEETDHRHFDYVGFPFDYAGNIVLDRLNGVGSTHVWIIGSGGLEMGGDVTRMKSNKGSVNGQFSHEFTRVGHRDGIEGGLLTVRGYCSGTRITIQGGVSSTMLRNCLAVLLAGMFGNTAPRLI